MRTILEILNLSADYLARKGIEEPRFQAEELVSSALGVKRLDLYLQFDRPLVDKEVGRCREWLQRRSEGEPLQYIQEKVEFFHCSIKVTPAVLIPRQETEILVDKIVKELSTGSLEGKVLWDLCCGSGCIGIALKKRFPELRVCLSDISQEALSIAAENCRLNEVELELFKGDLLAPFHQKKADFVVCNPPYITAQDYALLDREVRHFEPKLALIGGESGLEFYERLSRQLPVHLNPGAKVWFEIGTGQGEDVQKLFQDVVWKTCCVEKDWSCHERFFSLEIE